MLPSLLLRPVRARQTPRGHREVESDLTATGKQDGELTGIRSSDWSIPTTGHLAKHLPLAYCGQSLQPSGPDGDPGSAPAFMEGQ